MRKEPRSFSRTLCHTYVVASAELDARGARSVVAAVRARSSAVVAGGSYVGVAPRTSGVDEEGPAAHVRGRAHPAPVVVG